MWFAAVALMACGESVTFEEPAEVPEEVADVEPADPIERAPDPAAPIDGRPDEVEVKSAPPPSGQPWPPIVIPQDQREREWDWEFENKGSTKRAATSADERKREMTLEEAGAEEMRLQKEGREPDLPRAD